MTRAQVERLNRRSRSRPVGLASLACTAAIVVAGCGAASRTSTAPSATTPSSGQITVRSTETLKSQDVTNGGVSGTGHFTISGAISDKGKVTDYRTAKGSTALVRRVTVGEKGTITFLITLHLGSASPAPWKTTSGTKAYAGLHGRGTQIVDNFSATPATFVLQGTVSH
jgi:hypothetical protein